jgi:hypothetical protein
VDVGIGLGDLGEGRADGKDNAGEEGAGEKLLGQVH